MKCEDCGHVSTTIISSGDSWALQRQGEDFIVKAIYYPCPDDRLGERRKIVVYQCPACGSIVKQNERY